MKRLFVSMLAIAAMASCSKNETEPVSDAGADKVEIMAKSVTRSIETKAPFEGTIGNSSSLTARVLVSATSGNYTTTYHDGQMTFNDNGTTQVGFNTTPAYYPVDGSTLYLCGLYPADENWKNPTTTVDYEFDGKTDIMAAAEASSSKSQAQAQSYPTLAFNHLLTKLVVKVKAEDQAAIDSWGNITDLVLTQAGGTTPYTKATVTLATGAAETGTAFSTTKSDFPFYTMTGTTYNEVAFTSQSVALTTDAANLAYSLVAPITATGSNDFKLKIKTQKGLDPALENEVTIGLQQTAGGAFSGDTQGKSFEITLTFKATEIKAKATVTDWVKGGSASAEIQ